MPPQPLRMTDRPAGWTPDNEQSFRAWYAPIATQQQIDSDPDNPEHHYNYRAAWRAGATPGADGHWPSEFKDAAHPNRFVDGQDTIMGQSETLAQRIRSKHPGAYDDLADIELEQRVTEKYPGVYDDLPRSEATLTRERPAPGAPSALDAGHAPGVMPTHPHAEVGRMITDAGRAALDPENLPVTAATITGLATGGAGLPVAAGMAALAGGAGAAMRAGAKSWAGQHQDVEDIAADVGTEALTQGGTQLAGGLAGKAIQGAAPALKGAAGRVSSSALKVKDTLATRNPGLNIPLEAAKRGVTISPRSVRAIDQEIGGLKGEVDRAVEGSTAAIRPSDAAMEARELLRARKALGSVAADDVAQIRDEIRAFVGSNEPVPAAKMQEIKEFLQGKLKTKFGATTTPARVDAQQALRSGARGSIEAAVPDVVEPNAEMRRLIPIRQAVKDALKRTEKWDLAQIIKASGGGVLGGVAGLATGSPVAGSLGTVAGAAAARALDNPANKSRMAAGLYRAGQAAESGPVQAVGDAVAALGPLLVRLSQLQREGDLSDEETGALVDTIFEDAVTAGDADLAEPVTIEDGRQSSFAKLPIALAAPSSRARVPIPLARR